MVIAVAMLSCCALAGCDDGRPRRVPVSGRVLIDGKPLRCGFVRFVPADARPSGGQIDRHGCFRLTCFEENDGAVPGTHKISVTGCEATDDYVIWNAPKKYADPETSGLVQVIDGPTDSVEINLTWDGGKPFAEFEPYEE
jgi:hypothetical protein